MTIDSRIISLRNRFQAIVSALEMNDFDRAITAAEDVYKLLKLYREMRITLRRSE